MDSRRLLLVAAGAALTLLAAVPAALSSADPPAPPQAVVQAASVVPALPEVALGLPGSTTTVTTTKQYDGRPRTFVLHVPDGLLAPAPLVVALHAHSHSPDRLRAISRLERLADEQGFVVAFPGGAGGSWNAGLCCRPGSQQGTDDVAFLDEVVALARAKAVVDPSRLFLTGGSNGAMMALRYACERSETVAAVAVVSGPLVAPCAPTLPVPVLVLHGGQDVVIPLGGGQNSALGVTFPPVEASLQPFREAGGEVRVQVVPPAGHTWMTRDLHGLDATRAAWEWLRDHPRAA